MPSARQFPRIYQTTLLMSMEDAIAHVDGCEGRHLAGACGGLYVCNSCGRTIGRCHSNPDMPAVCVLCRARYLKVWSLLPHLSLGLV
jgi:hypothetical protein